MKSNPKDYFDNPLDRWLAEYLENGNDDEVIGYMEQCNQEELTALRKRLVMISNIIEIIKQKRENKR